MSWNDERLTFGMDVGSMLVRKSIELQLEI